MNLIYSSFPSDSTFMFMSSQITGIIRFFLARNLAIARQRAWDQVVASRGKSVDFWGPYAEGKVYSTCLSSSSG